MPFKNPLELANAQLNDEEINRLNTLKHNNLLPYQDRFSNATKKWQELEFDDPTYVNELTNLIGDIKNEKGQLYENERDNLVRNINSMISRLSKK